MFLLFLTSSVTKTCLYKKCGEYLYVLCVYNFETLITYWSEFWAGGKRISVVFVDSLYVVEIIILNWIVISVVSSGRRRSLDVIAKGVGVSHVTPPRPPYEQSGEYFEKQ